MLPGALVGVDHGIGGGAAHGVGAGEVAHAVVVEHLPVVGDRREPGADAGSVRSLMPAWPKTCWYTPVAAAIPARV